MLFQRLQQAENRGWDANFVASAPFAAQKRVAFNVSVSDTRTLG